MDDQTDRGSGYAVGAPGTPPALDTWQDQITVDGVHMFDMNTFNGTDIYQAGVAGNGTPPSGALATASRTFGNPGIPIRSSGGK